LAGDIIRRNSFKLPELLIPTTFRLVSTTLILRIGLRGLIWELLDDQALTEHLVQDASVEPTALEVTLGDDAVKVELLRWLFMFIVAALNLSVVDGVAEEVGSRLTLPTSKPRLESQMRQAFYFQVAENAELALQFELGELEAPESEHLSAA